MLQLSIGIPLRGTNSKYSKVSDFYIVIIHWNPFKRYQFKAFQNVRFLYYNHPLESF